MSGRATDEPRAKRRRCAPKRYAEEDDASPGHDSASKASPKSNEQRHWQQQRQDAAHAGLSLQPFGCHTQARPAESEDEQALRIIQLLAVKLAKDGRPYLRGLFCQTNGQCALIRLVPGSIDICGAASVSMRQLCVCPQANTIALDDKGCGRGCCSAGQFWLLEPAFNGMKRLVHKFDAYYILITECVSIEDVEAVQCCVHSFRHQCLVSNMFACCIHGTHDHARLTRHTVFRSMFDHIMSR